ncbi:type II toxin-antitoxin system RelB/DinJ family antitoxin [Sebaldella termitidis]|uniref:type II toxin-antitoxin system RelB/DinJ family antitoxin n=1 Tax=Sebaldella termitidis TaxID=826 RepID=UPI003EB8B9CE
MKAKETNKDTLQIRIDKDTKKQNTENIKINGIRFYNCNNHFFNKVNNEQTIPFTVTADGFYSDYNEKMLMKSIKQAKEGKVIVKTLEELEELENE